jgi:hypothetical protein
MSDTLPQRPTPKRPENGLLAWQATVGYISAEHSPDALLTLQAMLVEEYLVWAASVTWANAGGAVENCPSLPHALHDLWLEVARNHRIFNSLEAAVRQPSNYGEHEWVDVDTQDILDKISQNSALVFGEDWKLVMIYQPVEAPHLRVQARLLARNNAVQIGGRGATFREACRELYRSAAKDFRQFK